MGCIYSSLMSGICQLSSKDDPMQGCDKEYDESEEGYLCAVEEDQDPSYTCECYESDSMCHNCGADYNLGEDCEC